MVIVFSKLRNYTQQFLVMEFTQVSYLLRYRGKFFLSYGGKVSF